MNKEFDVWSSADGRLTSRLSTKAFVDNADAPYSFDTHEIRVSAINRKDAIRQYRAAKRAA